MDAPGKHEEQPQSPEAQVPWLGRGSLRILDLHGHRRVRQEHLLWQDARVQTRSSIDLDHEEAVQSVHVRHRDDAVTQTELFRDRPALLRPCRALAVSQVQFRSLHRTVNRPECPSHQVRPARGCVQRPARHLSPCELRTLLHDLESEYLLHGQLTRPVPLLLLIM